METNKETPLAIQVVTKDKKNVNVVVKYYL